MILIILYIIGCILAYGRVAASFYCIDRQFIESLEPEPLFSRPGVAVLVILVTLLSWAGFIMGIMQYCMSNDYYFLKFSNKDLWEEYNKNQ